jgi:hypothetical protein
MKRKMRIDVQFEFCTTKLISTCLGALTVATRHNERDELADVIDSKLNKVT